MNKRTASGIGIVLGIAMIIIGFCVMNPGTALLGSRDATGALIEFGADFYTEIYHMTYASAVQTQEAYVNICRAIGWLIVVVGLFDIAYFVYKLSASGKTDQESLPSHKEQSKTNTIEVPCRCGKCGYEGVYSGDCPSCGSSIKFYK